MSATDELRAELTKRDVEWEAPTSFDGTARYDTTAGGYWFHEYDGKITVHGLTPVQAIAATLGAGTCHVETTENWLPAERYHRCKNCRAFFAVLDASGDIPPRVCPNCGRRIV